MKTADKRGYRGLGEIWVYNRRWYAIAGAVVASAALGLYFLAMPAWLRLGFYVLLAAALYGTVASLVASHYIYDRSPLLSLSWVEALWVRSPQRMAQLHAGLDQTSQTLRKLFPQASLETFDFYDPRSMTEDSIRRARHHAQGMAAPQARAVEAQALPVPDETFDAVFLIFSAHEIRSAPGRRAFFLEIGRILRRSGRVLLVEHLRDAANALVFGPGFFHFFSRKEWLTLAQVASLRVVREFRMTPFVAVFVLEKPLVP